MYASIKHFQSTLEARTFTIFTDHKPLVFAFDQQNEKATPRQLRHLDYISQFSTDIQHISGIDNVVADTLSRISTISPISFSSSRDYNLIASKQLNDDELKKLKKGKNSLKLFPVKFRNVILQCDVSLDKPRPFIPNELRNYVFQKIHSYTHSGVKATCKQIFCRSCVSCQRNKVQQHNKSALEQIKTPNSRLEHIHIDLIGPLPPSEGFTHCLTVIDRFDPKRYQFKILKPKQ